MRLLKSQTFGVVLACFTRLLRVLGLLCFFLPRLNKKTPGSVSRYPVAFLGRIALLKHSIDGYAVLLVDRLERTLVGHCVEFIDACG